jgi:hypothetical protein
VHPIAGPVDDTRPHPHGRQLGGERQACWSGANDQDIHRVDVHMAIVKWLGFVFQTLV